MSPCNRAGRLQLKATDAYLLLQGIRNRLLPESRGRLNKKLGEFMAQACKDRLLEGRFKTTYAAVTREIRKRGGHTRALVRTGKLARSIKRLSSSRSNAIWGSRLQRADELVEAGHEFLAPDEEMIEGAVDIAIDHVLS